MPYNHYYDHIANLPREYISRNRATVYPGAVCPTKCNFGRVHGTAPATGSVTFKGSVSRPVAEEIEIQIGSASWIGLSINCTIDNSTQDGNQTTFTMVDMRDRLHDVNLYAQFNMIADDGQWWHITPGESWDLQLPVYLKKLETIGIFAGTVVGSECPEAFSSLSLLQYLADTYNFQLSYSDTAEQILDESYIENLDFNTGTKVIDVIDILCSKSNLQFTAWGKLVIHITQPGKADNDFEDSILAGTVDLCALGSHTSASLGSQLNEKGRRVKIVGGRNSYECWFPCFPYWNVTQYTWNVCNDAGYVFSAFLRTNAVSRLNRMRDLPQPWEDDRFYQGRTRANMSIRDYIEQIPFKVYAVDFSTPLIPDVTPPIQNPIQAALRKRFTKEDGSAFVYNTWLQEFDLDATEGKRFLRDSKYPISRYLASDSTKQYWVIATSRQTNVPGILPVQNFSNGQTAFVDSPSLDLYEYISHEEDDDNLNHCLKLTTVSVVFQEKRYKSRTGVLSTFMGDIPLNNEIEISPDQVFIRLALDRELYTYIKGEAEGNIRSREIAKPLPTLFKSYIDFIEQPKISLNYLEFGSEVNSFPDDIAEEIATRVLNHEFLTTSGHIDFRTNCGYMCSGIISTVTVNFDAKSGTKETIVFTNVWNDIRLPSYKPAKTDPKGTPLTESQIKENNLRNAAKDKLQALKKSEEVDQDHVVTRVIKAFGGATFSNITVKPEFGDLFDGQMLIVDESEEPLFPNASGEFVNLIANSDAESYEQDLLPEDYTS